MRAVLMLLAVACASVVTGCAGTKFGGGYRFDTRELFLSIERPLENGLKK